MPDEIAGTLLPIDRCRELFAVVQRAAKSCGASQVEVIFSANREALTRFANNTIHQNVAEQTRGLSIRIQIDGKTARAITNLFGEDAIRSTVDRAVGLAKSMPCDSELLPLAEHSTLQRLSRFDPETATATPNHRAEVVAEAVRLIEGAGQVAAGIYSTSQSAEAIFNSRGMAARHAETMARFSVTAMAENSSGWAKASAVACRSMDPIELARRASEKALRSRNPREIEPGRYAVVLEPAAVLDLVGQMFGDFSATAMNDQRSFLMDRLGTRLFGENIQIYDDVSHPLQSGAPFDGEGVPRQQLLLVEAGVPRELAYARSSAHRAGVKPTGHGFPLPNEVGEAPMNIVIAGGTTPVNEIIASTARGILVTRFWYIREVDPYEKIMTGMTRDGTFLIEDGRVVGGLRNLRFNQSIIELLRNVEALSPTVRASGEEAFDMVVPAMKVRDFHFTEVTRF